MLCYNSCKKWHILVYIVMIYFIPELVNGTDIGGINIPDKLFGQLYSLYKDSQNIDEGTISFRRVFADNKKYQIHVMKLTEVNGNKRHNLMVKEDNATNPLIYIENPVETKIPNAYLTFEEFKKKLTERVLKLREEFVATAIKIEAVTNSVEKRPISKKKDPEREVKMLKTYTDKLKQTNTNNKTIILINGKNAKDILLRAKKAFKPSLEVADDPTNKEKKIRTKIVFRSKTTLKDMNSDIINNKRKIIKRPVLRTKTTLKAVKIENTKKEKVRIKRPAFRIKTKLNTVSAGTTLVSKVPQNSEATTNMTVSDKITVNQISDITTESLQNVTVETSVENPLLFTENPIEHHVAVHESTVKPEPTLEYTLDLSTISTTEAVTTNDKIPEPTSSEAAAEVMRSDQTTIEAIMKPKRTSLSVRI